MQILHPFNAPKPVGDCEPAARADQPDRREKRDDHPAAERVVAEITLFLAHRDAPGIRDRLPRAAHELTEACIRRAGKAPEDASEHDGERGEAQPFVRRTACEPGRDDAGYERPVRDSHERVPHTHAQPLKPFDPFGTGANVRGWKYASTFSPFSFMP